MENEQIVKIFNDSGYGVDFDDLTIASDTIEDFKNTRLGYAEQGSIVRDDGKILEIERFQHRTGQPRRTMLIVDGGEKRYVYIS